MSFVLDTLLDTPCSPSPPQNNSQLSSFCRSAAILSCTELLDLVSSIHEWFLKTSIESIAIYKLNTFCFVRASNLILK